MNLKRILLLLGKEYLFFSSMTFSQAEQSIDMLKHVNNPHASIKLFNVYIDCTNQFYKNLLGISSKWFRYTPPIGRVLLRTSLPLYAFRMLYGKYNSGLGGLNLLVAYLFTRSSTTHQISSNSVIYTSTVISKALGSEKWQIGIATRDYFAENNALQVGYLETWQHSFAQNSGQVDTQFVTLQPIGIDQFGKGFYVRR